jgi:polyisoprenoid-binding protein YceI
VRYVVDPSRSRVWIDARSSLHPIHSQTDGLEGWLEADPDGHAVTAGEVALPVDRLSSGNPLYDREMRRRVDVRRYPSISGRLTSMQPTGHDGRYHVAGEVTFRGVSHEYEDEMQLQVHDDGAIELDGEGVFDIRDFGMEPPRILTLRVYPDVSVRVSIVAARDGNDGKEG